MAVDLAIDFNSGDLLISPNNGIEIRTGQATVDQRIRVRLKVFSGTWELDPTGTLLGSRLSDAKRLPMWRAIGEVGLMVREALEPMEDIEVQDVIVDENPEDAKTVDFTVIYRMVDETQAEADRTFTDSLTIEG
jgi:hypothetical protein